METIKVKNCKLKTTIKELVSTNDDAQVAFASEIEKLMAELTTLKTQLNSKSAACSVLEREKSMLEKNNSQMMKDYRYDLDTLKKGMKTKAEEDELLFKRVLDEKGMIST